MIDLKHELAGFWLKYNGRINYSVRPSERKKGYACQMLFLVLKRLKILVIKKFLCVATKQMLNSPELDKSAAVRLKMKWFTSLVLPTDLTLCNGIGLKQTVIIKNLIYCL